MWICEIKKSMSVRGGQHAFGMVPRIGSVSVSPRKKSADGQRALCTTCTGQSQEWIDGGTGKVVRPFSSPVGRWAQLPKHWSGDNHPSRSFFQYLH